MYHIQNHIKIFKIYSLGNEKNEKNNEYNSTKLDLEQQK